MALISIATSTFNRSEYIKSITIPSLLSQSFQDWEFCLTSDFDSQEVFDDLSSFFERLNDKRIKYFNAEKPWYRDADPVSFSIGGSVWNIAGVPALNKSIENCTGDYLFRLDDDDFWAHNHLEVYLEAFTSNRECAILHSAADFYLNDNFQCVFGQPLNKQAMLSGVNQMFHSTVAWRRSLVDKQVELYSDNPILPADLQQWQKYVNNGYEFKFLPSKTVTYLQRCSLEFSKRIVN